MKKLAVYLLVIFSFFSLAYAFTLNITSPSEGSTVHINTDLDWDKLGDFKVCNYSIDGGATNYSINLPRINHLTKLYNLNDVSALDTKGSGSVLVVAGSSALVSFLVTNLSNILTGDTQVDFYRTGFNPSRVVCKGSFDCFISFYNDVYFQAFEVSPYTEIDFLDQFRSDGGVFDFVSDGSWAWLAQAVEDNIMLLDVGDAEDILFLSNYSGAGAPNYLNSVQGLDLFTSNFLYYASVIDDAVSIASGASPPIHLDTDSGFENWLDGAVDVFVDTEKRRLFALAKENSSIIVYDLTNKSELNHLVSSKDSYLQDSEQLYYFDGVLYVDDLLNTQILAYDVSDYPYQVDYIESVNATNRTINFTIMESLRDFKVDDYILYVANNFYDEISIFTTRTNQNITLSDLTTGNHNITISCKTTENEWVSDTNAFTVVNFTITDVSYSPRPLYNGSILLYINFSTAFNGNGSITVSNASKSYTFKTSAYSTLHPHSLIVDFEVGDNISIVLESCDTSETLCLNHTMIVPSIINYPLHFAPVIRSNCAIESNCSVIDNNSLSYIGSWENNSNVWKDQEILNYSVDFDILNFDISLDCLFNYAESPLTFPSQNAYVWSIYANCNYDKVGLHYINLCIDANRANVSCQLFEQDIKDTFWGDTGLAGTTSVNADGNNICSYSLTYDSDDLAPCQKERLIHSWFDMNENAVFDATAVGNLSYTPDPDCSGASCNLTINRSLAQSGDVCSLSQSNFHINRTLVSNDSIYINAFDVYLCYENSAWNDCDCYISGYSFANWVVNWNHASDSCGATVLIPEPGIAGFGDINCNPVWSGAILNRTYKICSTRDIYDNTTGKWCVKVKDDNLECNLDTTATDFDSDGTVDATDVCCGYNDSLDNDVDGIPNDCDVCIESPNHEDLDSDGFPDCVGTCFDGIKNLDETEIDYGGLCGTCFDEELSYLLNETEIDYGGTCGFCLENSTKDDDIFWLTIPTKKHPFNESKCEEAKAGLGLISGVIILLLTLIALIALIAFIIVLLPYIITGASIIAFLRRFFGAKKNKKFK